MACHRISVKSQLVVGLAPKFFIKKPSLIMEFGMLLLTLLCLAKDTDGLVHFSPFC
jgi:hypothetical protein